eukprot:741221-Prorocentrum_minimum.AAC.1
MLPTAAKAALRRERGAAGTEGEAAGGGEPPTGGAQPGGPPAGETRPGEPPTEGMQPGGPPAGGVQPRGPPTGGVQPDLVVLEGWRTHRRAQSHTGRHQGGGAERLECA